MIFRIPVPDGSNATFEMNFFRHIDHTNYMGYHNQLTTKHAQITKELPGGSLVLADIFGVSSRARELMREWLDLMDQLIKHFDGKYSTVMPYFREVMQQYQNILGDQVARFPRGYNINEILAPDIDLWAALFPNGDDSDDAFADADAEIEEIELEDD